MSNVENRVRRLESLVAEQREIIEQQRDRIDKLESADKAVPASSESTSRGATVGRRDALKAGGLLGLLVGGVGTASADS